MKSNLNNDIEWIPCLHESTKWEKVSEDNYLLYNEKYETRVYVSYSAISIVLQINNKDSVRQITDKLTQGNSSFEDYIRVLSFIKEQLHRYGILSGSIVIKKTRFSHLYLEKIIIPKDIVYKMSKPFLFLFQKNIAIFVSACCLIGVVIMLVFQGEYSALIAQDFNIVIFCVSLIALVLCHELGHCSALQYLGKRSGGIGIGFYFFSPVFFADVNESWMLTPKKRIIVDLGGLYFQLIATFLFGGLYYLTRNTSFLEIVNFSLVLFFFNVNPFINTDGYWFLSDLLNYPNMNQESMKALSSIISKNNRDKTNVYLVVFGALKIMFMITVFALLLFLLIQASTVLYNNLSSPTFMNIFRVVLLTLLVVFLVKGLFSRSLKSL